MGKALSDEYIETHFMNGYQQHNNQIYLEDYQDNWPLLFQREKERIQNLVKENVCMIEHIGSTSVPGLCAKPILDILLVVEDSANEESYLTVLCEHGYVLRIREPEFEEHRMLKGPDTDINLHVFSQGSIEIEKYLSFRDYLREHQDACDLYAQTKRMLAKKTWKYIQNYADAKTDVVQSILQQSELKKDKDKK